MVESLSSIQIFKICNTILPTMTIILNICLISKAWSQISGILKNTLITYAISQSIYVICKLMQVFLENQGD